MGRHAANLSRLGNGRLLAHAELGASKAQKYSKLIPIVAALLVLVQSDGAAGTPSCTLETRALPATGDLYTDSLDSGCQLQMVLSPGADCNEMSFLHVEIWDLRQLLNTQEALQADSSRADPLLGMAQGSVPNATFTSSDVWDVLPAHAVFDTKGYELMRTYMHVQSAYAGAIPNGSWYISLQNLDSWTSGLLDFQIRATCTQQPQCPAPVLNTGDGTPRVCSEAGQCSSDGRCSCEEGRGDVGCSARTPVLGWGVEEAHSLASADWMYWELQLEEDAAAILVQLTRSAGDPVLFLKPQLEGFQVCDYSSHQHHHWTQEFP